jgi:hypothetical protein
VGSLRTNTLSRLPFQRVRAEETEIRWSGARPPSLSPSDTPPCRAIRQCRTHAMGKPRRSGRLILSRLKWPVSVIPRSVIPLSVSPTARTSKRL